MVPEQTIQTIAETIARKFDPYRIILFGSQARGEANRGSDVDLFIEMDLTAPRLQVAREMRRAFTVYPCAMDIVIYTPAETKKWSQAAASLASTVLREGKVLYERQPAT